MKARNTLSLLLMSECVLPLSLSLPGLCKVSILLFLLFRMSRDPARRLRLAGSGAGEQGELDYVGRAHTLKGGGGVVCVCVCVRVCVEGAVSVYDDVTSVQTRPSLRLKKKHVYSLKQGQTQKHFMLPLYS